MQKVRTSCTPVQDDSLANDRLPFALLKNCSSRVRPKETDT